MTEENCIGCDLWLTGECLKQECERYHRKTPTNPDKVSEQMVLMFKEYNTANGDSEHANRR